MKKVIFDYSKEGHHLEYILHLLRYLNTKSKKIKEQYIFIVNPLFFKTVNKLFPNEKFTDIKIVELTTNVYHNISPNNNKQTVLNSLKSTIELSKIMLTYKADLCVLLSFDDFFKGLVFNRLFRFRIMAIWFQPFARIPKDNINNLLKGSIKRIMMRFVLISNKVEKIFILNDKKTVQYLNDIYRTKVFCLLRDPINVGVELVPDSFQKVIKYGDNRISFLLFGSISKRKGALVLLEAIKKHIAYNISKKIRIYIYGMVQDYFKKEFYLELEKTRLVNKNIQIIIDDRFISYEEIIEIFKKSDFVLAPYINFYGSSGILGYSAFFERPIICSDTGLMSELVKEYKIGYVVKVNPMSLGLMISRLTSTHHRYDNSNFKSYVKDHSIESFTKTIFANIDHI